MSKFHRSSLAPYMIAAVVFAVTGCAGSLGNELTREPKPLVVAPRDCGPGPRDAAACLAGALLDSVLVVSPLPQPPDSTVVRGRVNRAEDNGDGQAS